MFGPGESIMLIGGSVEGVFTVGNLYEVGGRWAADRNPNLVGILCNDKGVEDQWFAKDFERMSGPW